MTPGTKAIFDARTRKTLDTALVMHCAGELRPDHATPDENPIYIDNRAGAKRRLTELLERRKGRPGRPPHHCVTLLFAGPPRHGADDAWPRERVDRWAKESIQWAMRTFPDSTPVIAALHMDESAPHVHMMLIPEVDGELGWRQVSEAATGKAYRKSYEALHDSYAEAVASKYGLARGERKSKRRRFRPSKREGRKAARENAEGMERKKYKALREKAEAAERARYELAQRAAMERAGADAQALYDRTLKDHHAALRREADRETKRHNEAARRAADKAALLQAAEKEAERRLREAARRRRRVDREAALADDRAAAATAKADYAHDEADAARAEMEESRVVIERRRREAERLERVIGEKRTLANAIGTQVARAKRTLAAVTDRVKALEEKGRTLVLENARLVRQNARLRSWREMALKRLKRHGLVPTRGDLDLMDAPLDRVGEQADATRRRRRGSARAGFSR